MTATLSRRLAGAACAAAWLASALPAPAQSLKPWRQALIIPKADAGFFLMAAKRGFLEKRGAQARAARGEGRPDRHEGAALRRGRQLRRRRRRDRRQRARRRRQAARLPLARRALRHAGARRHRPRWRTSRASRSPRRRRARRPRWWRARALDARQHPALRDQARAGRRRSRPLQRAARRRGRRGGGVERISAAAVGQGPQRAGGGQDACCRNSCASA